MPRDERAPDGVFFPDYWRSLIFLPDGAVAIVDQIRSAHERTCHFRLLTLLEDLTPDGQAFGFSVWGVQARVQDFSPVAYPRSVATAHLPARVNADQSVATLRAENVTVATFAVVIGVGAAAGYRLTRDALGYDLLNPSGTRLLGEIWPDFATLRNIEELITRRGECFSREETRDCLRLSAKVVNKTPPPCASTRRRLRSCVFDLRPKIEENGTA